MDNVYATVEMYSALLVLRNDSLIDTRVKPETQARSPTLDMHERGCGVVGR